MVTPLWCLEQPRPEPLSLLLPALQPQGLPLLVCPHELLGAASSTKSKGGVDPQDPGNQLIIHKNFITSRPFTKPQLC